MPSFTSAEIHQIHKIHTNSHRRVPLNITVWTKSNCTQCVMTKNLLVRSGLAFDQAKLEAHPEQLQEFINAGFTAAPIVVVDGVPAWAGFRPDKVAELVALNAAEL